MMQYLAVGGHLIKVKFKLVLVTRVFSKYRVHYDTIIIFPIL